VSLPEETITLLNSILLQDSDPSVRISAIQGLATLGCYYPIEIAPIHKAASEDSDPNVRIAAIYQRRIRRNPKDPTPALAKLSEPQTSLERRQKSHPQNG
jgi:HEAT repeat protein